MTIIKVHGILGQEFGNLFRFKLGKAKRVLDAIDSSKKNFTKRVYELAREGCHYTILVDGNKITELSELELKKEPQIIDLVPVICGAGPALGAVSLLAAVVGKVGAAVAAGGFLGTVALTAVSVGLQLLLTPKPKGPEPASANSRALQESFSFSNKANLVSQGSPVPVGYGRLRVGSQVVQFCNKSFPQSKTATEAMLANPFNASINDPNTEAGNASILDSRDETSN